MRPIFSIISVLLISINIELIVTQSNESKSEENGLLLKRSLDKSTLRDLLVTRSLDKFDSEINSLSDLVKREDVNISKVSDTFLKTLLNLSPPSPISKPHIKLDINSILNSADNDLEDVEIFKKSQALGLSMKQFFTTIPKSTLSSTTSTTKTSHTTSSTTTTEFSPVSDEDDDTETQLNDDDDDDSEKAKPTKKKDSKKSAINNEAQKFSSKQLKQIYKFFRKKEKKNNKKDSVNDLLGSLLSSPNYEVHLKLRDSLAAKAANDALLKWHSKAPFASLNQLEEMYNKFYEFYYDYFDINSGHDFPHHYHHHHHHPHHDHHHLNLLDFLASKNQKSDEIDPKNSLYEKIVGSNYLTRNSLWNDYHHDHYPEHFNNHFHSHHLPHDFHHYDDPYHENIYNLHHSDPIADEFVHHDLNHRFHDYQTHFNNPQPHHHYHYSQHPVYDDYGHRLIYTTGQLERFPASNVGQDAAQGRPVVCTNYPDHSSEGFKSFISVESCNQPSFLGSNGVPLFGNGCVFKYMCELGYQPLGGITSSIKCNNGFWTARAVCIKQGMGSNQSNTNLLKRSDQHLSESESKRAKRSDDQFSPYSSAEYFDPDNNSTFQADFDTSTVPIETSTTGRALILDKLLENLKTTTTTKLTTTSTSNPIVDPLIDWSNIIDSDSEKTIYESFYELLENGSNKFVQNLDLIDLNGF